MSTATTAPATAPIARRASFAYVRYASVWEDADVLCEALAPALVGGRVLSIASAGDNVLALLTLDPAEVVAVDLSVAQLACLDLRVAAFRHLEDEALPGFLGVTPHPRRAELYRSLRGNLETTSRDFWDAHPEAIVQGVIHAGKFERYLRAFRRWVLPLVHSGRVVAELTRPKSLADQASFYERRWDNWRWRLLFRLFFSRALMGRLGRDRAFLDYVEAPIGDRLLQRTRHAVTSMSTATNPYLAYIAHGTFLQHALPRYLRPEHRAAIRACLDRIRLVHGGLPEAGEGRFHAFNLSDIFEYMSPAEHERCYAALMDRAVPGARLAYWNMLAPRACPERERYRVRPLPEAADLHARDRAWFYQAFHLDEVLSGASP